MSAPPPRGALEVSRCEGDLRWTIDPRVKAIVIIDNQMREETSGLKVKPGRNVSSRVIHPRDWDLLLIPEVQPVLHWLDDQRPMRGRWGKTEPGRNGGFYSLEPEGREGLQEQKEQWTLVTATSNRLWGPHHA